MWSSFRSSALFRVIDPDARFLFWWRVLLFIFTAYNMCVIPYRLAFDGLPSHGSAAEHAALGWDHAGDIIFLLDIIVQARTGFHAHGVKVMEAKKVGQRYARSWMVLDIAAAIPFDFIELGEHRWIPAVRLPKLLRLLKLEEVLSPLLEKAPTWVRMFPAPLVILYVSHLMGCGYMGISRHEGFGSSDWGLSQEFVDESTPVFLYLYCFFWAYSLMTDRDPSTTSGGTPDSTLQSLFTMTAMLLGVVGIAFVIGKVAAAVDQANEAQSSFQASVSFVARFMSSYDVPPTLKQQVASFHSYVWSKTGMAGSGGAPALDLPSVLGELPEVLTTDISMHLLYDTVCRVDLFAQLDPGFIPALIKKARPQVFLPGDFIVTYGDYGDSMYFLQSGEVDIIKGGTESSLGGAASPSGGSGNTGAESGEIILQTLRAGDRFGEYSLILPTHRTASARARLFVTVYVLARADLEELMRVFAKSAAVIRARAKANHAATIKREEDQARERAAAAAAAAGVPFDAAAYSSLMSPSAAGASSFADLPPPAEPVQLTLQHKHNAREYRKKILVHAFKSDSPVSVHKSWGLSQGVAGDWVVIGGESDAYVVPNELFCATYESIPNGAAHTFRKKGTVLATEAARAFSIRTGTTEIVTCAAGDFLVQDEKFNQYFVPGDSFRKTYEVTVEKVQKKANVLDANSAAIRALKSRTDATQQAQRVPGVILPSSRGWQAWQLLICVVVLYNIAAVPLRIAFAPRSTHAAYLLFDYLGDALLWADVFLRFRLAFVRDGVLVTERREIAAQYRSSGQLAWDLVCVAPLDFIMLATGMEPALRLGRCLKLLNVHVYVSDLINQASSYATALKLARMMLAFCVIAHLLACMYFLFAVQFEGYNNDDERNWEEAWLPAGKLEHRGILAQYLRAQYFSFVVLTGFCGLVMPTSTGQALYSILAIMVGVMVVSLLIGEMASIAANMDTFAVEHDKRVQAVDEFCRQAKLPVALQQRVRRFLDHEWSVQRGADPNKALASLPPMLRLQLKMEICGDAIRRTPFFNRAADATLLAAVTALRFETYPEGETIFVAGSLGDRLFIISRGLVAIQIPHPRATAGALGATFAGLHGVGLGVGLGSVTVGRSGGDGQALRPITIKTVGKGSHFGEGALLKSGRRSASAVARSSCDLLVLHRDDFLKIVQNDPEFAEHLRAITDARLAILQRKKAAAAAQHALAHTQTQQAQGQAWAASNGNGAPNAASQIPNDDSDGSTNGSRSRGGTVSAASVTGLLATASRTKPPAAGTVPADKRPPPTQRRSMFVASTASSQSNGARGLLSPRNGAPAGATPAANGGTALDVVSEAPTVRLSPNAGSVAPSGGGGRPPTFVRSSSSLTTARDHRQLAQQRAAREQFDRQAQQAAQHRRAARKKAQHRRQDSGTSGHSSQLDEDDEEDEDAEEDSDSDDTDGQ